MERTVGQFASQPVHVVDEQASFLAALRMMSERRISCVVVTDEGEPVGILTERDIVFASNWVLGQPGLLVREVMNKPVLTVPEDMSISKAQQVFSEYNIRHLVILDQKLDLKGIFTQTDLVRALRDEAFDGVECISNLMTSQVLTVRTDVAARYALSQMARRAVSCVVVTQDNKPVGVFTERDVVRLVASGVDLDEVRVDSVMSASLITTSATVAPSSAIALMQKHAVRRLIVVNDRGDLAGVLTQTDLGRVFERRQRLGTEKNDHYVPGRLSFESQSLM